MKASWLALGAAALLTACSAAQGAGPDSGPPGPGGRPFADGGPGTGPGPGPDFRGPGPGFGRGWRGPGPGMMAFRGGPGFGPGPGGPGGFGGLRALHAADANGDGSVTRAEYDALAAEVFSYRDRNGDGALDLADEDPVQRKLAELRDKERAARDDAAPAAPRRGPRGPERRADANDDGKVTLEEYKDAEARLFTRLDRDADGVVTPDELDAHADARERGRWWRQP